MLEVECFHYSGLVTSGMAVNKEFAIFSAKVGGPIVVGRAMGLNLVGTTQSLADTGTPSASHCLTHIVASQLHVR